MHDVRSRCCNEEVEKLQKTRNEDSRQGFGLVVAVISCPARTNINVGCIQHTYSPLNARRRGRRGREAAAGTE